MRSAIVGIVVGLVIGVVVGARVIAPSLPEMAAQNAKAKEETLHEKEEWKAPPPKPLEEVQRTWRFTGEHSSKLPHLGALSARLQKTVEELSRGDLHIPYREPGALVPDNEVFDAVAAGAIDAAFLSPLKWAEKSPAINLIGGVPFGPEPKVLLAWLNHDEVRENFETLYHQHNVHGIPCGLTPAQSGGWFKEKFSTLEELKEKNIAIDGLGALVIEKLEMKPQEDRGGQIFVGFETGKLDGAFFHTPAIDRYLGVQKLAPYAYFPGWQKPAGIIDLLVNLEKWQGLSPTLRIGIEAACGDNLLAGYAQIEARQFEALEQLQASGANIRRWPVAIKAALKEAWGQVAQELAEGDENFKKMWADLNQFRANYKTWQEISRLK